jgi:hypothetical protein
MGYRGGALANGETYFKHGYGCLPADLEPWTSTWRRRAIDGFDAWRLWVCKSERPPTRTRVRSRAKVLADATAAGEIQSPTTSCRTARGLAANAPDPSVVDMSSRYPPFSIPSSLARISVDSRR